LGGRDVLVIEGGINIAHNPSNFNTRQYKEVSGPAWCGIKMYPYPVLLTTAVGMLIIAKLGGKR